ncbi:group I truncated hemoglobin [Methyloradius palustris]|uniref:Group 1 truncated hemoglobin n=1 Tax=Methyloradius palustris TaxID=2778876 RepID=A0A8D5FZ07_9PROT|nr:group 1 truncated hemoglobin [Methyloradius palustris]BCM24677.1 hypothetical protein ZMTM_09360 [Methyloradius palustris]
MLVNKTISKLFLASTLLMTIAWMQGCASQPPQTSLFERMGGLPVITVVVDETINQVSTDPKTKRSFEGIKLKTLKQSIVNQLCVISGGPCTYDGETMKKAHSQSGITQAEFELMVEDLRESLNRHVGTREKNEMLKLLAPMKRDIVTGPTPATGDTIKP